MQDFELRLMKSFTCGFDPPWMDIAAHAVDSAVFGALVFALLWLLVALSRRHRAKAGRVLLAAFLGLVLVHTVREALWHFAPRLRPGQAVPREHLLMNEHERATCASRPDALVVRSHVPKSASFPSSHAVTSGAVAAAIFFASRGIGIVAWIYALLVGVGRVWWAKHWPSDILGSIAIAAAAGWLAWRLAGGLEGRIRRTRRRKAPESSDAVCAEE